MKNLLFVFALVAIFFYSCKKSSTSSSERLFTFNSLKADYDSILQGNVTNIRANITGTGNYSWVASAGDVFGSGAVVLFGASTCCVGNHTITCTVTDRNGNSDKKSVVVWVHK
jgi:hypothetical protein